MRPKWAHWIMVNWKVAACIWEVSTLAPHMIYCNIQKHMMFPNLLTLTIIAVKYFHVYVICVYLCLKMISLRKRHNDILLQEWWNSCEKGILLPALKKHWRIFVLSVFGNNHDPGKEERLAHKFLFRPMEYFLCRQDPEVVFEELKAKNMPSQLCGKVFKTGEPTYSCR